MKEENPNSHVDECLVTFCCHLYPPKCYRWWKPAPDIYTVFYLKSQEDKYLHLRLCKPN